MNREAWRSQVQARPGCEFATLEVGYLHSYPLPTESLNQAVITLPPTNAEATIEAAAKYFAGRSPRWSVVCRREWEGMLDEACRKAGLSPGARTPTMFLPADGGRSVPAVPGLACRKVEDWSALERFSRTFTRANELPETDFWLSRDLLAAPGWDLLVAYLGDEPVATGIGFTSDEITGLWGIATLPEMRGRGIGAAITHEVVRRGARRGARAAHLWATPLGYPVYLKLGFRHVEDRAEWTFGPSV